MTSSLPTIIGDYFAAADRGDADGLVRCFTSDAVVFDEDKEWRGHQEISEWRRRVATAFSYTLEVRGIEVVGSDAGLEHHHVHTHLEGDFPGGTVDLTFRFALRDGRIASLQIRPTTPREL